MHLKTKILLFLCTIIFCQTLALTAFASDDADEASTWDKFKDASASLWGDIQDAAPGWAEKAQDIAGTVKDKAQDIADTVKDKAPDVIDSIKENAPDAIDAAKDKAQEIAGTVKDKAPEVIDQAKDDLKEANDAFSEYRNVNEQEFWQWFNNQTHGGNTTASDPIPATTPTPAPTDIAVPGSTQSSNDTPTPDQTTVTSDKAPEALDQHLSEDDVYYYSPDHPADTTARPPATTSNEKLNDSHINEPAVSWVEPADYEQPTNFSDRHPVFISFIAVVIAVVITWVIITASIFGIKYIRIMRANNQHKSSRSRRY